MNAFLFWIFSWVCGQNAEHTWAPAGELLPVCQRCTGLYAGAAIALVLMVLFPPRMDSRYRWFHTMLVLAMAPFGFHLVPHGAVVRSLSGQCFGFGVVGLLWLFPGGKFRVGKNRSAPVKWLHPGLGLISLVLLPPFECWGGMPAASILPWLALSGLIVLTGLLAANVVLFCSWLFGSLIKRMERKAT